MTKTNDKPITFRTPKTVVTAKGVGRAEADTTTKILYGEMVATAKTKGVVSVRFAPRSPGRKREGDPTSS